MECGIIGLPNVGKTTLFRALTGSSASGFSAGAGQKPNVGVARIPDPRLAIIAAHIPTKKIVNATIQFVDLPGIPAGGGAAKVNVVLGHVRNVEAMCQVVRCYEEGEPAHAEADINALETELILADLQVAENAKDKAVRTARTGEAEAKARVAVLEKVIAVLNDGKPLKAGTWTEPELAFIKSYGMISIKPMLYVANVAENDVEGKSAQAEAVVKHAKAAGGQCVVLSAKLEAELSEIDEVDRLEMLQSMGLTEPAIGPLARATNALLGLACFYTAGEKEVRAWPIVRGATAPEAAGSIHSDIERGFIRAETFSVSDLEQHKSEKAIREAGKLRSEGKAYVMQDGDVVHFLFNV